MEMIMRISNSSGGHGFLILNLNMLTICTFLSFIIIIKIL